MIFKIKISSEGNNADKDERDDTSAKTNMSDFTQSQTPTSPSANGNNNANGSNQSNNSQPKTASIRSRPTSNRITAAELEVSFCPLRHISPLIITIATREKHYSKKILHICTSEIENISSYIKTNFHHPDLYTIYLSLLATFI